jgi:hypothetical protein
MRKIPGRNSRALSRFARTQAYPVAADALGGWFSVEGAARLYLPKKLRSFKDHLGNVRLRRPHMSMQHEALCNMTPAGLTIIPIVADSIRPPAQSQLWRLSVLKRSAASPTLTHSLRAQRGKLSPDDILALMKKGNKRFYTGKREDHPGLLGLCG